MAMIETEEVSEFDQSLLKALKHFTKVSDADIAHLVLSWRHNRGQNELLSDFLVRNGVLADRKKVELLLNLYSINFNSSSSLIISRLFSIQHLNQMIVNTVQAVPEAPAPHEAIKAQFAVPENLPEPIPASELEMVAETDSYDDAVPADQLESVHESQMIAPHSSMPPKSTAVPVVHEYPHHSGLSTNIVQDSKEWELPASLFAMRENFSFTLPPETFIGYFLKSGADKFIQLWPMKRYYFGSAQDSDMIIPEIAFRHAVIEFQDSGFVLTDLEGGRSTEVNGKPVTSHLLDDQDKITIGGNSFHFLSGEESRLRLLVGMLSTAGAVFSAAGSARERGSKKFADAASFAGELADISLADLLQFLGSTHKSGNLNIKSASGTGSLVLKDGHVIFAEAEGQAGPDAVYLMVGWNSGSFEFGKPSSTLRARRNVSSTTVMLLMESMRRLDEVHAAATPPAN